MSDFGSQLPTRPRSPNKQVSTDTVYRAHSLVMLLPSFVLPLSHIHVQAPFRFRRIHFQTIHDSLQGSNCILKVTVASKDGFVDTRIKTDNRCLFISVAQFSEPRATKFAYVNSGCECHRATESRS